MLLSRGGGSILPRLRPSCCFRRPCSSLRSAAAVKATSSNMETPADDASLDLLATSQAAMQAVAAVLARDRRPGDVYLLYGSVGAGKSAFR